MTLETLIMQPGINPEMVYVAVDEKLDEMNDLVQLFEFNTIRTSSSSKYMEQMDKAIQALLGDGTGKVRNARPTSSKDQLFHNGIISFKGSEQGFHCDRRGADRIARFPLLFHAALRRVHCR
jgi:hypothetical protein